MCPSSTLHQQPYQPLQASNHRALAHPYTPRPSKSSFMPIDKNASSTSNSCTCTTTLYTHINNNITSLHRQAEHDHDQGHEHGDGDNRKEYGETVDAETAAAAAAGPAALISHLEKDSKDPDPEMDHDAINPLGLEIRSVPGRGRGVFARTPIPASTNIEESPVLLLSKEQWDQGRMNDTILGEYAFSWSNGGMAIGLGLGMSIVPPMTLS